MLTTTQVDHEVLGLIEFIETGLLSPALKRRLGAFPAEELTMASRDLVDWLSLRGILRGRTEGLSGRVHPLTGRVVAKLEGLSQYLCVPGGTLEYRVEVPVGAREELEDYVMGRVWHRRSGGRRAAGREGVELAGMG
jgi:hypothetical protein